MMTRRLGAVLVHAERIEHLAALIAFDIDQAQARAGFDLPKLASRAASDLSFGTAALKAIAPKMALTETLQSMIRRLGCEVLIRVQVLTVSVAAQVDLDMNTLRIHVVRAQDAHPVAQALACALGPSSQTFLCPPPSTTPDGHPAVMTDELELVLKRWHFEARGSVFSASEQLALEVELGPRPSLSDAPRCRI